MAVTSSQKNFMFDELSFLPKDILSSCVLMIMSGCAVDRTGRKSTAATSSPGNTGGVGDLC